MHYINKENREGIRKIFSEKMVGRKTVGKIERKREKERHREEERDTLIYINNRETRRSWREREKYKE